MNKANNQKGSSLVELIMVMVLLLLFGMTIFTLIYAGADTQKRIMAEKDSQMDARIAVSYINVRLRQNDAAGKVSVEKVDLTGENGILIKERTIDYEYDTWIYWYDGRLYECLVNPDEQPSESLSFFIVDAAGFETEFDLDTGSITNTVTYNYGDTVKDITSTVYFRSR